MEHGTTNSKYDADQAALATWQELLAQRFRPTSGSAAAKHDFNDNPILTGRYEGLDESGRYPRHLIQTEGGELVFINGGSSIDRALQNVPPGTEIAVRRVSTFRTAYGTIGSNFQVVTR